MIIRNTLFALATITPVAYADNAATENNGNRLDAFELPDVEVIGTTPLGATGLSREKVSGNVQSAEDEDIQRHGALSLSDFMNRRLGSVNINDNQNNPFQPDVTYRGFNASPLLGTPIGLSVYQDGVRVNEAFGDTVNWDLIPKNAIANIDLIPGSNPLFGLNTLGGALSVRTKSGFSHAGTRAEAYGGSFGRKAFEAEHGGSKGDFDWFLSGNIFEDDGWRPFTKSAVHQAFGKVGWENGNTDLDLSFTFADNTLNGVGPVPISSLNTDRRAIFTAPDALQNTLFFFNLKAEHRFTDELSLAGNAYYRGNTTKSVNSNTGNVDETCETLINLTQCADSEGAIVAPASNVANLIVQDSSGINLQLTSTTPILGMENQMTVGGGYNDNSTDFTQSAQDAVFSPAQATIGTTPFATDVNVKSDTEYASIFATNTLSVLPWLNANASAGWNKANVTLRDQVGTALNGNHTFDRLNPSAGFTVNPLKALDIQSPLEELTVYGNYNEGFRTPTPIELSCADPNAPCSLPNSFTSDPPLKPVVSKTFEAGVRGKFSDALKWSAALYHSRLSNDILFVNAPGSVVSGFFQNVGLTQRQGAELGLNGNWKKLNWYLNYSFVDATYQTTATLNNALGTVRVKPGNRIPGIPQQTVKLGAEYEILKGWFFGGDLQYASSQYLRGNDNNSSQFPKVSEYAIVNLNTRYAVTKNVELFAMARNVFDANYETYGIINQNFFKGGRGEAFLGPGAPISGWAGVRVKFD
ncbi:putative TonB-dependent receptor [Methyloglobulus morosus KoM1]|uniref:Putative TonB-dependent receptor n=1 Tax=Methyloglobulus morosus KoM1 TaxID=1116472 RepID=V5C5K4_9GAMM|nr:TonB-dependent receptor [Methyloglobulus morosus]ESS73742.1 putative TonB-dependent receptor [Methyloglobulus morosus KoM1]